MKIKIYSLAGALALTFAICPLSKADTVCDLTFSTSCTVAGATYSTENPQPTGTGNIDPFVQVTGNDTTLQAYNTTANSVLDNGSADNFNHQLLVSSVPIVACPSGVGFCYEFSLDINQTKDNPYLSLDNVQIYTSDTPNQSTTNVSSLGTLQYSLDTGGEDNTIVLNYELNNGSGSGDMNLFVPVFSTSDQYIYLYSQFGGSDCSSVIGTNSCTENDGFEEWYIVPNSAPVPEPGSLMLFGTGLLGMAGFVRRKFMS